MPTLGTLSEDGHELSLFQIHWPSYQGASNSVFSTFGGVSAMPLSGRLCVRYRGKAFLLDDKTPVLSIGRDLSCKLVVDDRKASRQHARIERRDDGFHLVDTSTNGSFVAINGREEVLLRRNELLLEQTGKISFGSSGKDPAADNAEFEHL